MTGLLSGDVALVTGGARGNGLAIALGLAAAGAAVAVVDIDAPEAEQAAGAIREKGSRAYGGRLDVTDFDACVTCAQRVERELGPISVLVNNAGILKRDSLEAPDFLQTWQATQRVNVDGAMNMTRAVLDQLRRTRGRVVNIGSITSFAAASNAAAYVTSKGAILQMTKALAVDLAVHGIRVNGIAPGRITTRMTEAYRDLPEVKSSYFARTPLGRYGEPEDLVGPVLFFASSMSEYVTGTMLPVDGGYLAA